MNVILFWVALVSVQSTRPELVRGQLLDRPASRGLASELTALPEGVWAGYSVPLVAGRHHFCGGGGVVSLDGNRWNEEPASLPGDTLFVLYRLERGRVTGIRALGSDCRIDAGDGRVFWLTGVGSRESVDWLAKIARGDDEELGDKAASAIAFHEDPSATALLGELAGSAPSHEVRKKALFWLGAARGEGGFQWLVRRSGVETSTDLREQIVFALHVSDVSGATEKLVELAKGDRDSKVRERALFWLAQKAGKLAMETIAAAVVEDPELGVKKKAVFALSQLPPDEGVPLLVEVAETHPQPEVRKQAFFWLGQSKDPRAAALFEKILLAK